MTDHRPQTGKAVRRPRTRRSRIESRESFGYAVPQLILYLGLQILPFCIALPIMFTDQLDFLDRDVSFVGFQNITSLFEEPLGPIFFDDLRRTTIFTLVNFVTVFAVGLTLALVMFEVSTRLRGVFFTIIYMPWMVSGVGIGLLMIMLFSRDTGTANLLIEAAGGPRNTIDVRTEAVSLYALPVVYSWKTAGFNMAIFLGGLLAIPKETIESSKLDGANYLRRVIHIYLPQMVPSLIIVTIFTLINSFGIFDELVGLGALGGNGSAEFLSIFIYELGFGTAANLGSRAGTMAQGITASLVVFLPLVLFAFYLNRLQKKLQYH